MWWGGAREDGYLHAYFLITNSQANAREQGWFSGLQLSSESPLLQRSGWAPWASGWKMSNPGPHT